MPMLEDEARKRMTSGINQYSPLEKSPKPSPFHAPKEAGKMFNVNERRAGEMLKETTIKGGERHKLQDATYERVSTLKDLGIQKHESHRWQKIADEVGVEQKTISNVLDNFSKNGKYAEITKMSDFQPFLYNVWNLQKN